MHKIPVTKEEQEYKIVINPAMPRITRRPGMHGFPLLADVLSGKVTAKAAAEKPAVAKNPDPSRPKSALQRELAEIRLLIHSCDYRGEQLNGPQVGGCGCLVTWWCGLGRGLPMTPNEVNYGTCVRCVSGRLPP